MRASSNTSPACSKGRSMWSTATASNLMSVPPPRLTRSMRSRPDDTALRDILHHIELAAGFAAGFDAGAVRRDLKTVYAVTRCLEIISEASRRLADDLKARHPAIGWKQMAAAGKVYRHDYEEVGAGFGW